VIVRLSLKRTNGKLCVWKITGCVFSDAGSSESEPIKTILLIMTDLMMAMFFAYSALLSCKLLKIN
jgi:hypothetical protein